MRRIAGILLLVIYLNAILKPVYPVFNYQMDKTGFLAKCINKDKPALKCEGKCQLASEVKKATEQNEHSFQSESSMSDEVQWLCPLFVCELYAMNLPDHKIGYIKNKPLYPSLISVFHPPIV